jgi:hypothetical protein
MWRSLFLAVGFFMMLLGMQCLGVEKVNLKLQEDPVPSNGLFSTELKPGGPKQIIPPPWAPWSLLSSGAVMCLYSFTIPRRVAGG